MGKLSMVVAAKVDPVINVTTIVNSECLEQYDVLISTGVMQTRHVTIIGTGQGAFPQGTVTDTITMDTTYSLFLDGLIQGDPLQDTVTARIDMVVRNNNATGAVLENRTFIRQHSGNIC